MNGFDLSTISGLYVGSTEYSAIYKGSVKIWEATPPDYSLEYFTIQSLEDNNAIHIYGALGSGQPDSASLGTVATWYYSTDKVNWTEFNVRNSTQYYNTNFITLNKNQKVYLKTTSQFYKTGIINTQGNSTYQYNYFGATKNFKVYGNIMSLCYGDNFTNQTTLPWTYTFYYLFRNCSKLIDASNLILPATTLTDYCYNYMFYNCSSLTTAPELPATTLTNHCYNYMFYGCSSLTTAPELPATTLNIGCYVSMFRSCTSLTTAPELPATTLNAACYMYMFYGCTSLTTAPSLPATTLQSQCYQSMFQGCTSLTTAPELKATSLVNKCYHQMFYGCTLLNYVKALFTTDISSTTNYTNNWLYNVAATGTFIKGEGATWSRTDATGIPSGWTVKVDGAPEANASINLYTNYNTGTAMNLIYSLTTGTNYSYGSDTSAWHYGNNKYLYGYTDRQHMSVSKSFELNIVFTGFTQFKVFLIGSTLDNVGGVMLNKLNDNTNVAYGDYSSGNEHCQVYAGRRSATDYTYTNLDPNTKYNIAINFRCNSSTTENFRILIPTSYPQFNIINKYFTSSSEYNEVYGS